MNTMSRPTEQRNSGTTDIDLVPSERAIEMIVREDAAAVDAVRAAAPMLGRAVDAARARLEAGGHLHYFGAGASGRLAVLDATELTPTFGYPRAGISAHFPGGIDALIDSAVDMEDSGDAGERDAANVSPVDVVVGVTASGTTPYVAGALRTARGNGALTILLTNNRDSPLAPDAEIVVLLETGAEAITGSTRLKAGTATKVALNAFSTALMVGLGRTYSNLMVDMVVTNLKLEERALHVLQQATSRSLDECAKVLSDAGGRVPVALVSLLADLPIEQAERALARTGSVRRAVTRA